MRRSTFTLDRNSVLLKLLTVLALDFCSNGCNLQKRTIYPKDLVSLLGVKALYQQNSRPQMLGLFSRDLSRRDSLLAKVLASQENGPKENLKYFRPFKGF